MDTHLTSIIETARAESIRRRVGTEQVLAETIYELSRAVSPGFIRATPIEVPTLRLDDRKAL